jgi:hypothetical protein
MTRDLRKFARQTNSRLILGGLALLVLVGDGLIYLFFGDRAAITGLICFSIGLAPLVLIWTVLWLVGWIARRAREE